MNFKNTTIAAAILFSLTACGSSSGGSNTVDNKPTAKNEQTQQQVADAKKAEETRKAEKARQAEEARKAEETRQAEEARKAEEARQAAETIRLKKNELFNIAKSIGLPDEVANQYAERFSQNPEQLMGSGTSESYLKGVYLHDYLTTLLLNDGLSNNEVNQIIDSLMQNNGNLVEKAQQEAEILKQNKAKKAQQEAEILRQNKAKKDALIKIATDAGLINAEQFASNNLDNDEQTVQNNLETALISEAKGEYADIEQGKAVIASQGVKSNTIFSSSGITQNNYKYGTVVYNQKYSIVTGNYEFGTQSVNGTNYRIDSLTVSAKGLQTKPEAIPTEGKATYSGKAFVSDLYQGDLSYDVNFANRTGSGVIRDLGIYGDIQLEEGTISKDGISTVATQGSDQGNYDLKFFGKNAEEIGGKVSFDGKDTVGFGGTRGEIQK